MQGDMYNYVAVGHRVYCFGGNHDCMDQIDVHVFNTVSLCWKKLPPVTLGGGERHLNQSCRKDLRAMLVEDTVYIWGGLQDDNWNYYDVLYAFHVDAHRWFKPSVSGTPPMGRVHYSACVLGKVMFIYGGYLNIPIAVNDMYKLDTATLVWSFINARGTPPQGSFGYTATIIGTKMFVFGGCLSPEDYSVSNTTSVFDTETNCWLNTPSAQLLPEPRWSHSAFTYNGQLYIYGGLSSDNEQELNDIWKFNPDTFSWKEVEAKGKGQLAEMYGVCCCAVGDRIIVFGRDYNLSILDLSPSLKTLCKLAVIHYGLEQSELPHNIRWELAAIQGCFIFT